MIIRAHSVPILPSGLSPMQERLLRSEKNVRLVSAPTGSGKTYTFIKGVLDEDARVLFIVPTKRLLQNLIDDARRQALEWFRNCGWSDEQIEAWRDERITEWSGNQATESGESRKAARARQFLTGKGLSGGQIIFAIPEVVVQMISGVCVAGASAINPFLYVRIFDHIIFDEFHTIDDHSFGLACLLSLLAVSERQGKVSLLSATPIDVTKVLECFNVGPDKIETIDETVVAGHPSGNRPIHGNVTVSLQACSVPESLSHSIDAVRASIADCRTVILIYDSLERLKKDEPKIREILAAIDVPKEKILLINSIDDSVRKLGDLPRVRRYANPHEYDVLLCTSSVEIGVTFNSSLMFTEPGYDLASFVQRVGRVARGALNGQVIVSLSNQTRLRHAWTRRVAAVIERDDEMEVQAFIAEILRDARCRFEPARNETASGLLMDDAATGFYRRASWRGVFWAALFIVALRRSKMTVQRAACIRLGEIAPPVFRFVEAKIREILSVDIVNVNLRRHAQPHRRWVDALLASALTYRDIGATITVVDPGGKRRTTTESFLRRATDILGRHIILDEDGGRVVNLLSRTLDEEIQISCREQDLQRLTLNVKSPIGENGFSLSIMEHEKGTEQLYRRLVEEWRSHFGEYIPLSEVPTEDPRKRVMGAATDLIERLGRPPLDEDFEDAGESALFA